LIYQFCPANNFNNFQLIWLVSFSATVGWDLIQGLVVSIGFALMTVVFRTQWPRWHLLSNLIGTNDFRDAARYQRVVLYPVPFSVVFRYRYPLYRYPDICPGIKKTFLQLKISAVLLQFFEIKHEEISNFIKFL
jgi:hypothetical protein